MVGVLVLAGGFVVVAADDLDGSSHISLLDSSAAPKAGVRIHETVPLAGLEKQLLDAHNAERTEAGLETLETDATLVDLARQRAQDMVTTDYFSHASPNGDTVVTLLKREGYEYKIAAENIARNNRPNDQAVGAAMSGFLDSDSHREKVLNERYDHVGVGTVTDNGMNYFVVIFTGD